MGTTPLLHEPSDHLATQLQQEVLKYPGKWVATTSTSLVAVGESAKDVYDRARKSGIEQPIVFKVASSDRAAYFF